jgi:dsRNA-specific ribonuclease
MINMEENENKIKRELGMLTPHISMYGDSFVSLISNILCTYGRIKKKYLKLFTTSENIKKYQRAFTSNSVNSFKNVETGKILGNPESENTYELFKILGDNIFENFMVWYLHRRFPTLRNASDVKVIARLKINYDLQYSFPNIAKELGFLQYISSSEYERMYNENTLLKSVFSSFLGVTYSIINDIVMKNGIGFAICYDILSSFYDKMDIQLPSKFEELDNPITTLKQFFDKNRYFGKLLEYEFEFDPEKKLNYCSIYYNKNGRNILLVKAESPSKKEVKKLASIKALEILDSKNLLDKTKKSIIINDPTNIIKRGNRGLNFINTLKGIFANSGVHNKYIDMLLSEEGLQIYDHAFTSNSANPSEDSPENYEIYETLGDAVFKNFIVEYSIDRFKLNKAGDLKFISRVKINYGSEEEFTLTSKNLGFLPFLTASQTEYYANKDKMLEDVFEAFLGATCYILDSKIKIGVGYCICCQIIKYICDLKDIPAVFEDLVDSITYIKEFFDKNPEVGILEYEYTRAGSIVYCNAFINKNGTKTFIGQGNGAKNPIAKKNTSEDIIYNLRKNGYKI